MHCVGLIFLKLIVSILFPIVPESGDEERSRREETRFRAVRCSQCFELCLAGLQTAHVPQRWHHQLRKDVEY